MANIIARSTDNKEIMPKYKDAALNMKMELVSSANLVEEAIDLVDRYRGYTTEKRKVMIDGNIAKST